MWGIKVHQAAISAGDRESGCTVHYVSEEIDRGAIIAQAEVVITPGDSADSLQQKVLAHEHELLVAVIKKLLVTNDQ
jgi:phosphoribosylglycinamide formyltransferase-1